MKEEEEQLQICPGYFVGFCPYEAFYIASITRQCPRKHQSLSGLKSCTPSFVEHLRNEAASLFRKIIKDTDKRVAYNKFCLDGIYAHSDSKEALKYTERLIEATKRESETTEATIHTLLSIHGQLIIHAAKNKAVVRYDVCSNCSAFKTTPECKHPFCKLYKKMRDVYTRLVSTNERAD